jgi:hypothetical protein
VDADAGLVAAADQSHAAAEDQLDHLVVWWSQFVAGNQDLAVSRMDEVCVLTRVLHGVDPLVLAAVLAAAVCRMSANTHDG